MSPPQRVIVAGAGLAGLAAAARLRAAGIEVSVLERGERVGGRATHDSRDGFTMDGGAQLVSARDHALLGLIAQAGLGRTLLPVRPLALAQVFEGVAQPIDPADRRGIGHIEGVARLHALRLIRLERQLRRFGDLFDPAAPERAARLDDRSLGDYVRLYFGSTVLERWAAPFVAELGFCDPEATSRLLFLRLFRQRRYAAVGSLRDGLGHLCDALAKGDVRLGSPVEAIEAGAAGLRVTVGSAGSPVLDADAVVLALPAGAARAAADPVLGYGEREILGGVRYAPAVVLTAALSGVVHSTASRVRVPACEGGPIQTIHYEPGRPVDAPGRAAAPGGRAPEGKSLVALVGRPEWSRQHLEAADEVVEKALLDAFEGVVPGTAKQVEFTTLRRYREAVPLFDVGRYRGLQRLRAIEADRRAAGRRLYYAGDYTTDPTLEGAVVSGQRAADALLADLG